MSKIILKNQVVIDSFTNFIEQGYDLKLKDGIKTEINYDPQLNNLGNDWNIGVIYGHSGSGKSTILKKFGEVKTPNFLNTISVGSNFIPYMESDKICHLLCSMGLSSVPTWVNSYNNLSNGEKYRADLALLMAQTPTDETLLIDEYTSVVDRDVAKSMSYSFQKYVRQTNRKVIIASCHQDIFEWLKPDWIYSPTKGQVERPEYLRQGKPEIKLQIVRANNNAWEIFKKHHYLSSNIITSAKCYVALWDNKPVAINCVFPFPNGNLKNAVRGARLVVLPDYQGLGIGIKLSEYIAGVYTGAGYRYFTKTVHPATGNYRNSKSDIWRPTAKNGVIRKEKNNDMNLWTWFNRKSYCHEYIGKQYKEDSKLIA